MIIELMMIDMFTDASTSVNTGVMDMIRVPGCCVLESTLDEHEADQLAAQLKALADPTRLRIVSMLATSQSGELCACDLPAAVGKSQPTTSHHLRQLVDAGLIEREQRGKWAWFRLRADRLADVRAALGERPAT